VTTSSPKSSKLNSGVLLATPDRGEASEANKPAKPWELGEGIA
jgi:hypothetical protein